MGLLNDPAPKDGGQGGKVITPFRPLTRKGTRA
jgi:hypothetical protein